MELGNTSTRAPACPNIRRSMSRSRRGLNQRTCSRCMARGLRRWKEKLQHAFDACRPAPFVVFAARRFQVRKIVANDPAFRNQCVTKSARVADGILALRGARVEPDSEWRLHRHGAHLSQYHAVVPPNGW